jgi:hypothetical protein
MKVRAFLAKILVRSHNRFARQTVVAALPRCVYLWLDPPSPLLDFCLFEFVSDFGFRLSAFRLLRLALTPSLGHHLGQDAGRA